MTKHKYSSLIATLSYFLIGIIWYFVDEQAKKDEFIKFHVKQGITFLIFSFIWAVAYGIILSVLAAIFSLIPFLGSIIIAILGLGHLIPLIFAIIGIIHAINGQKTMLPIIGHLASKLKF